MGRPSENPVVAALLAALREPLLVVDPADRSLRFWNERAEAVYGPLAEGQPTCCRLLSSATSACEREPGSCPVAVTAESGAAGEAEHTGPATAEPGGRTRIRTLPIRDADGSVAWVAEIHEALAPQGRFDSPVGEAEPPYRVFFEEGPLGMAITLPDKTWAYVNDRLCAMLGYSEDELRAMTWAELTHPEDRESNDAVFDRARRGELDRYELEKRFLRKDGGVLHVRIMVRCERDPSGEARFFFALVEDITEQRLAEQRQRDSAVRYRTLFEQIPDAVVVLNRERFLEANSVAVEIFGCASEEELLAYHPADLSPERQPDGSDSRQRAQERIEEAYREGSVRFEWLHQRPRTGEVYVSEVVLSRLDLQGEPVLQAVVRDITERKSREDELRSALSLTRAIQDSIVDGILVVDLEGRVVTTNGRFAEMWGIPDEVLETGDDRRLLDYVLDQVTDPDGFLERVRALYEDPQAVSRDFVEFTDGRVFERFSQPLVMDGEPRGRVWSFLDITERKLAENQMAYMAYHDLLTGLPNRRGLQDALGTGLPRARESGSRLGVIFLDLEDFKDINDSLGHSWGDSLLIAVAERLRGLVGDRDTVARFGGDEFAILLEGIEEVEEAAALAERMVDSLTQPIDVGDQRLSINASLGLSFFPEDGDGEEDLLAKADAAMYRAKEEGRNTYRFFTSELSVRGRSRLVMKQQLREAIEADQLLLHFQPQVALAGGEVVGLEGLVRWQHPEEGLLMPARFIPLAEESGLIVPLGEWVLRRACRQGAKWLAEGCEFGRIAVNIGADHIKRGDLPDKVAAILEETGLPGSALAIEITEASLMDRPRECVDQLRALHELGVQVVIDDFGTGYSSLAYLKRFPIDRLKIDKGFIGDLPDDDNDAALVRAIIALGSALGLSVVAEGVETEAQAGFLREAGCELGQGFLWAEPRPHPALVRGPGREGSTASAFPRNRETPSGG